MKKKAKKSHSPLEFRLGDLKYFDGSMLFKNKDRIKEDRVILGLAQAYNDLKSSLFLWEVLEENKPKHPGKKVSAVYGQHSGMMWITYKTITGIIHEIAVILEENKPLFKGGVFKQTTIALSKDGNKAWENFWDFIFNQDPKKDSVNYNLRKLLLNIRNNASFHYHQSKKLQSGYEKHFFSGKEDKAYFCSGPSMETTRFHFADAALEQYLMTSLNTFSKDHNEVFNRLFQLTHTSIYFFIEEYLRIIDAEITTLGDPRGFYDK